MLNILLLFLNVTTSVLLFSFDVTPYEEEKALEINKLLDMANDWYDEIPDSTIVYANSALVIAENIGNKKLIAESNLFLGIGFWSKSNYDEAQKYYFEALRLYEEEKDMLGISKAYNGIALTHWKVGNLQWAKKYHYKALSLRKTFSNSKWISQSMNNLALLYIEENTIDSALYFLRKIRSFHDQGYEQGNEGNLLINMGNLFYRQGDVDSALDCYNKSLEISINKNQNKNIIISYGNLGTVFLDLGQAENALSFFNKALHLSIEVGVSDQVASIHKSISKSYEKMNFIDKAFEHYKESVIISDSIRSAAVNDRIAELQALYESREKNRQLEIQEIRLKLNNRILLVMTIVVFTLLLLIAYIVRLYLQRRAAYKVLANKNFILANSLRNPIDSDSKHKIDDSDSDKYIYERLERVMKAEQIYLQQNITIENVANLVGTNRTYLSRAIKLYGGCNFNNYVNNYRIQDALIMLANETKELLTIEAIAQSVGFRSKSTFNKSFKEYTGITPSIYKSEIVKSSLELSDN